MTFLHVSKKKTMLTFLNRAFVPLYEFLKNIWVGTVDKFNKYKS